MNVNRLCELLLKNPALRKRYHNVELILDSFVGQSRLRKIKSSKVLPRSVIGLLEGA